MNLINSIIQKIQKDIQIVKVKAEATKSFLWQVVITSCHSLAFLYLCLKIKHRKSEYKHIFSKRPTTSPARCLLTFL